jgi:hypothetical protein
MTNAIDSKPESRATVGTTNAARCQKIGRQIGELKALAASSPEILNLRNPNVSQWSVAQQLDHTISTAKMLFGLIFMLIQSKSSKSGGKPKFIARVILATGYLPRGRGKSPKELLPAEDPIASIAKNLPLLEMAYKGVWSRLAEIERCTTRAPHPALGAFTPAQWLRFIEIHNHHHFKIIRDIRRKS